MKCLMLVSAVWLLVPGAMGADPPSNLLCEWERNPTDMADPCPEFAWEAPAQSVCQVQVFTDATGADAFWDSGRREQSLSVIEYAGPPLKNDTKYFWRCRSWSGDGAQPTASEMQSFIPAIAPRKHHLPTVRTFINFAGGPAFAKDWLDLCFRKDAKEARQEILAVRYGLVCTMVLPHPSTQTELTGKANQLENFCIARGLTTSGIAEDMFCHFSQDTKVKLHVGKESMSCPVETRTCPGWDPKNDRNADGTVDDDEAAQLMNPQATARHAREARIPIYYWGPPRDDFVMNVGNAHYREFMATVHAPELCEGWDGIYFDTVPSHVPGPGHGAQVLEYPGERSGAGKWVADLQRLFARIKTVLPDKLITGNGWDANPMVLDGRQLENWMQIQLQLGFWRQRLDEVIDRDRRGKVQLIQYNPIWDEKLSEFGPKLPMGGDRDKIFGLATYLLAHGDYTYFGFGRHPYSNVTKLWFEAMKADLGDPVGAYRLFDRGDPGANAQASSVIVNGGFENAGQNGLAVGWEAEAPVALDTSTRLKGKNSVKITSTSAQINNFGNRQYVTLKPHTTYTLIASGKAENVMGAPGAQVYPYDFEGAQGLGMLTWKGTCDWREQRLVFTTGEDAHGRITFRMYGATGTVWFDNIKLLEGQHTPCEIYAREYTKGLVLVKPYVGGVFGDETVTRHSLPESMCALRTDDSRGNPVTSVSLRNAEAVILLR